MKPMDLDFGEALHVLNRGGRVQREGWNGKGMWLVLVQNWIFMGAVSKAIDEQEPRALERAPFIAMRTADEKLVPWLASQTDMLATDWRTVLDGRNGD